MTVRYLLEKAGWSYGADRRYSEDSLRAEVPNPKCGYRGIISHLMYVRRWSGVEEILRTFGVTLQPRNAMA